MKKKQLTSFIDKYHLAGNANSVKLEIKDKVMKCDFITDDQNVVGSVSMNNFDVEDVTLGVYATSQLTKLLTALDDDVDLRVNNADGTAFSINLSDPPKSNKFITKMNAPSFPFEISTSFAAACAVPPVAIRSSIIKIESFSFIESL